MRRSSRWSLAGAVLLVLVLVLPVQGNDSRAFSPAIEGTWLVNLVYHYTGTPMPDAYLQYIQQVDRHGRAVIYLPHNPADYPWAESRTTCSGEWRPRGHRTFDVTLYCLWRTTLSVEGEAAPTPPDVPDRIRMKFVLDKKGRAFTATPFYYERWDGAKYGAGETWGEMQGTRLGVAPLP
jgi:hypothetical protein